MTTLLRLLSLALLLSPIVPAFAGHPVADGSWVSKSTEIPLVTSRVASSFVFGSQFENHPEASGNAYMGTVDVGWRIPLQIIDPNSGWFLQLGSRYERFAFGHEGGLPLPNSLQEASALVALEYFHDGDLGVLVQVRPGFYFENDPGSGSFDAPITAGVAIPVFKDFYALVGLNASFLRSVPIIPALGFFWRINPQWTVLASAPEPRITFQPVDHLSFWLGGQIIGGGYQVDRNSGRPSGLSGTVVTYSEYRAGAGVRWTADALSAEIGGGYSFMRQFDYARENIAYRTEDGAAYLQAEVRMQF
ncbi:MAG: hypothetical protein RLZZ253_775 [Verrucomicrobiota bacterium]|jgi:hypothetical protein